MEPTSTPRNEEDGLRPDQRRGKDGSCRRNCESQSAQNDVVLGQERRNWVASFSLAREPRWLRTLPSRVELGRPASCRGAELEGTSVRKSVSFIVILCIGSCVGLAGGPAAASTSWSALESEALTAVAARTGANVEATSVLSSENDLSVQTTSGAVEEGAERTLTATIGGKNASIGLTFLGGAQLLVNYWSADSTTVEVLALTPGTSRVSSSSQMSGATSTTPAGQGVVALTSSNCYPFAYSPTVIGSIFGNLIEAIGGAACSYAPEVLGAIVGLYSNGSGIGSGTAGSSSPASVYSYTAPYDYYPCYSSGSASPFQTAVIYSISGTVVGGGTSGNSWLDCQP
jgi:hypothetical protein